MQRIYLPNTQFSERPILSESDIHHQLTRVMRARIDDTVVFFDGESLEDYLSQIVNISKREIELELIENIKKSSENNMRISLFQALPNKFEKIEYIIQKCCEVGYKKIIFFESERNQKLVISDSKKQRFKKIAIEAIEQCGGNMIPELEFGENPDLHSMQQMSCNIVCHTQSNNSIKLSDLDFGEGNSYNIFVGPEGGFSDAEVESFETSGVKKIFFGNRILRCETVSSVVGFYIMQK